MENPNLVDTIKVELLDGYQKEVVKEVDGMMSWLERNAEPELVAQCAVRALNEITEPVARAVLDLHRGRDSYGTVYCDGCDLGCSCEAARWPCSTVDLIAEQNNIDLPGQYRANWARILEIVKED